MSRPIYTSFAWAYDLVVPSPGAPQADESARLLAGRKRIVDVGCGTGRHSLALAEAGFDVVGIDASADMIDVARERAPALTFEVADLTSWRPPSPFDGVLCRGVLNEITEDVERQAAMDSLFSMLRPGGLLVLGVREIERTRVRFKREPVITRSAEGVFFRAEGEFIGDVVRVRETISSADQRADDEFRMRPWSLTELDERAAAAGFTRVERRLEGDRIVAACMR
ncbi:MAG: class I SAM-dependent methyltransferase [Thermoleophilaceae bacterium]